MKSILVPTDFSKCASNAFHYALNLASNTDSELHLVHIVFPNEGIDNNVYNAFWSEEYLAQREKGLKEWAHRIIRKGDFSNVTVKFSCLVGFPVPMISETAENEKTDLIVMGTTGATGLRGVLLGSIAAGVLSHTQTPILAVPQKGSWQDRSSNVVFATDYKMKVSTHSMEVLHDYLKFLKARLKIVHIIDKPGEHPDKTREATLGSKLETIKHDFHYIHDRDVAQAISNFIESTDAQALVAVAHEHSLMHRIFFDSITRRLAHRTQVPILVLHDGN